MSYQALSKTKHAHTWETFKENIDVLLVEKHDRPLVNLMIAMPFGSLQDPKAKEGLSNLMAGMLLRGTRSRTRQQIEETLDQLGTSIDFTVGSHSLIVESEVLKKNLHALFNLLVEILTEPSFDGEELEKQKKEVIAQILLNQESDSSLAKRQFLKSIFPGHTYGMDAHGTRKAVETITRGDLMDHFKRFVHRGKLLVGAAGDLTREEFLKIIPILYDKLPTSEFKEVIRPIESKIDGIQVILVDKPDRSQTHFLIGGRGIPANHPDYPALKVFITAFAGPMFQAQYMNEIRVVRGWSYGAYGSLEPRRDSGSWHLYTFPKVVDTVPAIKLSLELLEQAVHGKGVTDASIEFAKNYLSRSFPFSIDLPEKLLEEKLYGRLLNRPDDYLEAYTHKIRQVTPAQAREAAQKHLDTKNLVISLLATKKDFESIQKDLKANAFKIVPYNEEE